MPIHLQFPPQQLSGNESGQDLEGTNYKGQTNCSYEQKVSFILSQNRDLSIS